MLIIMSQNLTTTTTVIQEIPTTLVAQQYNIVGQYTTLDSKLIKQSLNLYNTASLDANGNPSLVRTNYCAMGSGGLEILAYDLNNADYRSITYYSVQGLQASVMNIDNPLIKSTSLTCGSSGTESNVGTSSSDTSLSRYFSTVTKSNFTTSQTGTQYNFADKLTLKTTATLNQFLVDNNAGTAGHVLTSGGSGGSVSWSAPATDPNVVPLTTPPDSATLAVNNSVKIQNGETGSISNYIELSSDSGNNTISLTGTFGTAGQVLTTGGSSGSVAWSSQIGNNSQVLELNGSTIKTNNKTLINTNGSATEYVPDAAYGDSLIVYNDVGYVGGVSDGFGEVIFQNKSATANSSNIIAICEKTGDYMAIGQNSSVTTALNNTLFEIRGAGYSSSTGHQIIGANSAGSATKSVIISYANGAAGLQINPSGALGIGAVPTVVGTEVQLTNGSFGSAGQVLTSGGSAGPLSWTTPVTSTPNLSQVLTSGNTATDIYILLNSASAPGRINSLEYDGMHTDYNNMQVVADSSGDGMLWTNNKLIMAPRGGNPIIGGGGLCEYNMGYNGVINIPEAVQHMGLDFAYGGPTARYLDMQYKSTGTDPNGFFFQNYDGTNANYLHTEISQAMTGATTHNFLMYRKTTAGVITKQININQDNIVMTDNTSGVVTSTLDADNLQLAKTSVYTHDIKNNTSTNYLDLSSSVGVAIGATSLPLSLRGNVDAVSSLTANSGAIVFYGGSGGTSVTTSYTIPSSGVNREFYLTMTGTTASQVITLPTARNGYKLYITNLSSQSWAVNRTGTDVIYSGPNGTAGGTTITIPSNKTYELSQSTNSFIIVGETVTRTVLTVTSINSSQLNPNAPAYVRAPADCVEQFGTITTSGATTGSLTFPKAYSAAPCVTLTVVNSTVTSNAATMTSLSATAFNWHVANAAATSICWRATGTALATL